MTLLASCVLPPYPSPSSSGCLPNFCSRSPSPRGALCLPSVPRLPHPVLPLFVMVCLPLLFSVLSQFPPLPLPACNFPPLLPSSVLHPPLFNLSYLPSSLSIPYFPLRFIVLLLLPLFLCYSSCLPLSLLLLLVSLPSISHSHSFLDSSQLRHKIFITSWVTSLGSSHGLFPGSIQ